MSAPPVDQAVMSTCFPLYPQKPDIARRGWHVRLKTTSALPSLFWRCPPSLRLGPEGDHAGASPALAEGNPDVSPYSHCD